MTRKKTQPAAPAPTVADVMTQVVVTVEPDTLVSEVADLFTGRGISGAPVVSESGDVIGIVSSRDVLRALSDEPGRPRPVSEIATRRVVAIDEGASLAEAAKVLFELGIHRMIVQRDGKLIGILTATDILKWVARPALQDQEEPGSLAS